MKRLVIIILGILSLLNAKAQDNYKTVIACQYDEANSFSEGLAGVKKNGLYGFINKEGEVVIDFQFEFILDFSEGLAAVVKRGDYGFINKKGELIIDYQYDGAENFSEGLAAINMGGMYLGKDGYIDKTGQVVLDYNYRFADSFSEGLAAVKVLDGKAAAKLLNDKYSYIDKTGRIIIDGFNIPGKFSEGLARCRTGTDFKTYKFGFIDKSGNPAIGCRFDFVDNFSEGLSAVKKDGKWGFIDKEGNIIIDYQFDWACNFSSGLAAVKKSGKWGFINQTGGLIIDYQFERAEGFSEGLAIIWDKYLEKYGFIKYLTLEEQIQEYVIKELNLWIIKGEFEKTEDYIKRVNENTKKQKIKELTPEIIALLKKKEANKLNPKILNVESYDADNETFLISSSNYGNFIVLVPISEASLLKNNWNRVKFTNADFYIANNKFILSKLSILNPANNTTYKYNSKIQTNYLVENIEYNIENIDIKIPNSEVPENKKLFKANSNLIIKDSVDTYIPINTIKENNTFALIIGNESYKNEISVPYAYNDAKIFYEYCRKIFGIPENQIHLILDGTYGQILGELKWLTDVMYAFNGSAKIIFYYAGHGIPNESNRSAYLLPSDGNASITQTAISLDNIYRQLENIPSKSVNIFLDACFSGGSRKGMIVKGRGVRITPKVSTLNGNLIVFSATTSNEIALPYNKKQHGMFTYFLLKKINESKGQITLGELSDYIIQNVKQKSVIINKKSQTPKVNTSKLYENTWRGFYLIK